MLSTVATAAPEHQHSAAGVVIAGCENTTAPADLRCARAISASFDGHGTLWLAGVIGQHVYVSASTDFGQHYRRPVRVNAQPEAIAGMGEQRPKLAIDAQGRIFVSWTQKLAGRFNGHIRFSRSLDGGYHFSPPLTVNDHRAITSHRFESLAVNAQGDVFLAWLDKRDKLQAQARGETYRGAALYFTVSRDHGKTFMTNRKIIDHTCECCRTSMAMDVDQWPVIFWRHVYEANIRDHAMVKLHSLPSPAAVYRVSYDNWQINACPHHGPDLAIADNAVYHFAWFDNAPQSHGLFYARSYGHAGKFTEAMPFGQYTAQASHPQVMAVNHKVYLAWQEFDGQQSQLFYQVSADEGITWSGARKVASTAETVDYPLLVASAGKAFLIWHQPGTPVQPIVLP